MEQEEVSSEGEGDESCWERNQNAIEEAAVHITSSQADLDGSSEAQPDTARRRRLRAKSDLSSTSITRPGPTLPASAVMTSEDLDKFYNKFSINLGLGGKDYESVSPVTGSAVSSRTITNSPELEEKLESSPVKDGTESC